MLAVVDTGPLYAAADRDDADHDRCVELLGDARYRLVIPAMVVAEATYLVGSRLGPRIEARFLRGLESFDVDAPPPQDWPRMAALVERYQDLPLGGTDASVVAAAERLRAEIIMTLDKRDFGVVRPRHVKSFRLLP